MRGKKKKIQWMVGGKMRKEKRESASEQKKCTRSYRMPASFPFTCLFLIPYLLRKTLICSPNPEVYETRVCVRACVLCVSCWSPLNYPRADRSILINRSLAGFWSLARTLDWGGRGLRGLYVQGCRDCHRIIGMGSLKTTRNKVMMQRRVYVWVERGVESGDGRQRVIILI